MDQHLKLEYLTDQNLDKFFQSCSLLPLPFQYLLDKGGQWWKKKSLILAEILGLFFDYGDNLRQVDTQLSQK